MTDIYGVPVEVDECIPPGVVIVKSGDKTYVRLADGWMAEIVIRDGAVVLEATDG